MKVLMANIEDVMREAAARWTLVAYFFLSSIFILIFASAINLDIVDGALAGAKLFGKQVEVSGTMSIEKLVMGFESGFSGILYVLCTFLAIFATAHLVPRMQEKGTIDLYLSRPVSRMKYVRLPGNDRPDRADEIENVAAGENEPCHIARQNQFHARDRSR